MTTEIAVLNRLGVALAADSAVTITRGSKEKVFDTADKLFELSEVYPVAVMINGNMNCLGVPWELLVKDFRKAQGNRPRTNVANWCKAFVSYVSSYKMLDDDAEKRHVRYVIESEARALQQEIAASMLMLLTKIANKETVTEKPADIVLALIDRRLKKLDGVPHAATLASVDEKDFIQAYGDMISDITDEKIAPPEVAKAVKSQFSMLVAKSALSERQSGRSTGIVIAGYGTQETFPAMSVLEIDGRILGRLKVVTKAPKGIDHVSDLGGIQYFAQTDVIERLLGGADPRFVKKTGEFIEQSVKDTVRSMVGQEVKDDQIAKVAEALRDLYIDKTAPKLSRSLNVNFESMVAMMPKHDLIEFAEALVSITAVERKATSDIGTVGGPIDVALVTKHEGFVWVKRKHYFRADLNPRYFWRKYGGNSVRENEDETEKAGAGDGRKRTAPRQRSNRARTRQDRP